MRRRFDPISFLSRLLLTLLLVGAVLVVGSKLWVNHQINRQLERAQAAVRDHGSLTWREVYNHYDGRAGVRNLTFLPNNESNLPPVAARDVYLNTSYEWLIRHAILGMDRWPDQLQLDAEQLNVNLVDLLGVGNGSLTANPFEALGCGEMNHFVDGDLATMGIYSLDRSARLRLSRTGGEQLRASVTQTSGDYATDRLTLQLVVPELGPRAIWSDAVVTGGELELGGRDFNRQRNSFCDAQQADSDFLEEHMALLDRRLALAGWSLGPVLRGQYRRFASALGGPLKFTAAPSSPLALAELTDFGDFAQWLGDANLSSQLDSPVAVPLDLVAIEPLRPDVGPQVYIPDQAPSVTRRVSRWVEVSPGELARHVGRPIRISTGGLNEYEGYLESVGNSGIVIATRIDGGGVAQVPIPLGQLDRAEVIPREPR